MATEDTLARWTGIIQDQESSGLSPKQYALRTGINPKSLSWWRWNLRRNHTKSQPLVAGSFTELTVTEPVAARKPSQSPVRLVLEDYRAHLVVDDDTDLTLVRRLLESVC